MSNSPSLNAGTASVSQRCASRDAGRFCVSRIKKNGKSQTITSQKVDRMRESNKLVKEGFVFLHKVRLVGKSSNI